jgi:ribosomal protein L12E/L44/L45/RPP1/RPP2
VDAFKVVFTSGYIVYVSTDGQILASEAPQPVFVAAAAAPAPQKHVKQPAANNAPAADHEQGEHESEDND